MRVYIREWPNGTATIMSDNGQVIWTFSNTAGARRACSDWHNLVDSEPVILCDETTGHPLATDPAGDAGRSSPVAHYTSL